MNFGCRNVLGVNTCAKARCWLTLSDELFEEKPIRVSIILFMREQIGKVFISGLGLEKHPVYTCGRELAPLVIIHHCAQRPYTAFCEVH